jgi:hypothetical protein
MQETTEKVIRRDIPLQAGAQRPTPPNSAEIRQRLMQAAQSLELKKRQAFGRSGARCD